MEEIAKLNSMESSSTLFEKAIPVRLTKLPGVEERPVELTVRIVMGISKAHRSSKLLRIQLTDEADPFFFHFLEVSEDDFQNLKVEQCILVDFSTFPYKFIELLEHCIEAVSPDAPRFQATLHIRTGDSTFSIVEANQFKHLSHLSLCFRQGNDSSIKTYLAGRLAEFKNANADLHEKLRRTLMSLEMSLRENDNLNGELSEIKEANSRTINQLKADFTSEMANEKEKTIREYADSKEKLEKAREELEYRICQQAKAHQERLIDLEKQVTSLTNGKHFLELKVTETSGRLASAVKELEDKSQEYEKLRSDYQILDSEKQESLKALNQNLVRLGALDQEVHDKTELIATLQKQLNAQASQREQLEISLKDAQAITDRAEERSKSNEAELTKCQQTIEKLQAEIKTSKAKVKLKAQMASQQDSLLQERQAAIDRALQENTVLKQEIVTIKDDNSSLKKKIEDLNSRLQESQDAQQSNQQMIQWLNQQLTDAQLGRFGSSTASTRYPLRPSLPFLTGSDSTGRPMSNAVGSTFSASASLNGSLPSTTFKSMLVRSNTPFPQPVYTKPLSNGTMISMPSRQSRPSSSNTSPVRAASSMKSYDSYGANLRRGETSSDVTVGVGKVSKSSSRPSLDIDKLGLNMNKELSLATPDSKPEASSSWTLLPRPPPLSFVEARTELLGMTTDKLKHDLRNGKADPNSRNGKADSNSRNTSRHDLASNI